MAEPAYDSYDPEEPEEAGSSSPQLKAASHQPNLRVLNGGQKADSPSDLATQEASAPKGPAGSGGDDLNFTGDNHEKAGRRSKNLNKLRSGLKNRKWLLIGGIGGSSSLILIVLLLIFLAGLLKIPGLSALIIEQEFSDLDRQSAATADRVAEQELYLEAEPSAAAAAEPEYAALSDKGLFTKMFSTVNGLRPSVIVQNFENTSGFKLGYSYSSLTGGKFLSSVTIGNTTLDVERQGLLTRFIPGVSSVIDFKNDISLASDFAPALEGAMDAQQLGPIARFIVASNMRDKLGIGLIAWTVGKFTSPTPSTPVTPAEAQVKVDQAAAQDETESGTSVPIVDPVGPEATGEQDAKTQGAADNQSPTATAQTEANKGVDPAAVAVIDKDTTPGIVQDTEAGANPVYAIALPACIIYDGSLDSSASGPTINSQTQAQEKAFYFLADAGDEQDAGGSTNSGSDDEAEALAVGGMNAKLGDISQSNPYIQANGGTVDTSTSAISAEASPMGDYTLLNASGMPAGVANFIDGAANTLCPVLTNTWVAGIGALAALAATIAGDFVSFGAPSAGEAAAEGAMTTVVDDSASSLLSRIGSSILAHITPKAVTDDIPLLAKARALFGQFINKGVVTNIGATVGLTVLAKIIVAERAGAGGLYSGTEQGDDYANEAASGANIQAGELDRQQLFGRPLTCAEITQNNQADQQFVADQNQSKSLSDRYLALSNPDSLLSHVAMAVSTDTNSSLLSPLADLMSNFTSGPFGFGSMLGALTGEAHADSSCADEDYGNVQFGWSQAEESVINKDDSYLPLENQKILDSVPGAEKAIAAEYSYCFGYDYNPNGNGNLDPTDPSGNLVSDVTGTGPLVVPGKDDGSIGGLLTSDINNGDPAITRDSNGDVVPNQGTCSPDNLSYDSPDPLAADPSYGNPQYANLGFASPQQNDLIFRWRLAMSYDVSADQLASEQSVTAN